MNELKFCLGVPKVSGIARVRVALTENIKWQYQARASELDTAFVFKNGEGWVSDWNTGDMMTGDLTVEESKIEQETVDVYSVKLYFRHDNAQSVATLAWIEANFRNRKVALELTLETGEVRYLNPFEMRKSQKIKEDVGQSTITELSFMRSASIDTAIRIVNDEIVGVRVDCDNRFGYVQTENVNSSYEFAYSLTDEIEKAVSWAKKRVVLPIGNGKIYFFARDENEPNGGFIKYEYFLNCKNGGSAIKINYAKVIRVVPIDDLYEDIITDGEGAASDDYEDIETTSISTIKIKYAKRLN